MRVTAMIPMALLAGLSLAILTSCVNLGPGTTDTTRLYVLAPMKDDTTAVRSGDTDDAALGIGPLAFPQYLNRPQIVTRIGANEIQTADFANWAEPLQRNFQRVLSENLSLLLGTDVLYTHPWRSTLKPDQRIEMEIIRFEADPQGDATLAVRWEVIDVQGKVLRPKTRAVYRQPVAGEGYEAIVTAMSLALADFSRDIAAAITAL